MNVRKIGRSHFILGILLGLISVLLKVCYIKFNFQYSIIIEIIVFIFFSGFAIMELLKAGKKYKFSLGFSTSLSIGLYSTLVLVLWSTIQAMPNFEHLALGNVLTTMTSNVPTLISIVVMNLFFFLIFSTLTASIGSVMQNNGYLDKYQTKHI